MTTRSSKRGANVIDDESGQASYTAARTYKKQRTVASRGDVNPTSTAVESNTIQPNAAIAESTGMEVSGNAGPTTPKYRRPRVVTPSQAIAAPAGAPKSEEHEVLPLRRALLTSPTAATVKDTNESTVVDTIEEPKAKKRLAFGKFIETPCQKNVHDTYKIISRLTGSVGGNGSFGAIYGELTMGSMQKMVDLMKTHTAFDSSSRFIDVGSGIGKPNLHVCQDPGVEFSYGIEMEMSRWMLGLTTLKAVLKAASAQRESGRPILEERRIGYKCYFGFGNIANAKSFDPFTHVYMFSIGFPPRLFLELANMFNESSSPYLICYHSPSDIIDSYGFNVELVVQAPTSMHGSSEGHMGYIYKRLVVTSQVSRQVPCAPFFRDAWDAVNGGIEILTDAVASQMKDAYFQDRLTRSRGVKMTALSKEEEKEAEAKQAREKVEKAAMEAHWARRK